MLANAHTAIILFDPYNEFLHPKGKIYPLVSESSEATDAIKHMKELIEIARAAHIPIYYGLHQQYKDGNYDGWKYMAPPHVRCKTLRAFEEGADIYEGMQPDISKGDVVVSKH